MKNIDLIKSFIQGSRTGNTNTLKIIGDRLYTYNTILIERDGEQNFIYNQTKYSATTSRHQYYVRQLIEPFKDKIIYKDKIRINTQTLKDD